MKKIYLLLFGLTVSMAAQSQSIPSYVPSSGLAGWWPFNGNANDESGQGNNGTVYSATLSNDRFGYSSAAYLLNQSSNNYISVSNSTSLAITNDISISFWFKAKTAAMGYMIDRDLCNPASDWSIYFNGQKVTVRTGVSGSDQFLYSSNIPLNTWTHVVLTRSGAQFSLYINDSLASSQSLSSNAFANTSLPIYFGDQVCNSYNSPNFDGNLDDIGFWNRPLTRTEVTTLYNSCALGITSQPANQTKAVGDSAQFSIAVNTGTSLQWQINTGQGFQNVNNGGQFSGTSLNTFKISNLTTANNNTYVRCIVSTEECSVTSTAALLTVNGSTSVANVMSGYECTLHPSPAKENIILTAGANLRDASFVVVDLVGKTLISGKLSKGDTEVNVSNLQGGTYLVRINAPVPQTIKFVKY